jgi:photosystem II stability/assembly factor-like uncharacterized protein
VSYAVAADRPALIVATDGTAIYRSTDAGSCWKPVREHAYVAGRLPTTVLDAVHELGISGSGRLMYAAVSPCKTRRPVADVPGCTIEVSADGGASWLERFNGLPLTLTSIDALRVADSGTTAYVVITNLTGGQSLYGTDDAGVSWTLRADVATTVLTIDPADPRGLWAGGLALTHSTDGGRTWQVPEGAPTGVHAVDVQRRSQFAVVTVSLIGQTLQSADGGRSWAPVTAGGETLGGFASFAHLQDGTVAGINDMPRRAWLSGPSHGWRELTNGPSRLSLASADRSATPAFYFRDDPDVLVRYVPRDDTGNAGSDDMTAPAHPQSPVHPPAESCYRGEGNTDPAQAAQPFQPAPPGTAVYVTNADSGCVVAFDRNGKSTIMFQAPPHTEGLALGFDGQLTIGTRTSNQVVRTQFPRTDTYTRLAMVPSSEGPSFDQQGNLFVVDNSPEADVVYELPYPQTAMPALADGQPDPRLRKVWTFGKWIFLEDTRIAPSTSPFAGSLLVMYAAAGGNPDTIAMLRRHGSGWTRVHDFATLPFPSLGMAFAPDGSVLVPELHGGRIARISPDGTTATLFADLGAAYMLTKIDVSAAGDVYATSTYEGEARLVPGLRPGRNVVVRFDRTGKRLLPDFTANLSYPCGVTVPNVITGNPLIRPPVVPQPRPPGVNPPVNNPPPPQQVPQPQVQPGPAQAPLLVQAPAPAPAAQPQLNPVSQANPVAQAVPQVGLVPQKQTQVQVATVQVQTESGQRNGEYLMSRRQRHQPIPAPVALLAVGVVACCVQTRAWLAPAAVSKATAGTSRGRLRCQ